MHIIDNNRSAKYSTSFYKSTKWNIYSTQKRGGQELEVFGKPMLNFGTVDINRLQEPAQLGQDGLNILIFWEICILTVGVKFPICKKC